MSSLSIYLKIAAWRQLPQRQSLCVFFPPWFQNAWGQEREESGLMSWKTHPTQNQPIFMIFPLFGSITYRIMLQLLIMTLKAFIKLRSHCIPLHISQPGHMKLFAVSQTHHRPLASKSLSTMFIQPFSTLQKFTHPSSQDKTLYYL